MNQRDDKNERKELADFFTKYADAGHSQVMRLTTAQARIVASALSHVAPSAKERIAAVRADQAGEPISAAQAAAEIKKLVPANCRAAGTDMAVCRQWCGMAYCAPSTTPQSAVAPGMRKAIERELHDAENPVGMSTHDGKVRIDASKVRYLLRVIDRLETTPSATLCIPLVEIEAEIDHIQQNGMDLAKFGGQNVDEGRCRELCAMYLREFIQGHKLQQQLDALCRADGGKQT